MIYSTELASKIVITDSNKNSKFLEAGIHDNVKFTGARAATSPTGKNFMELRFEKDGKELLHTEWEQYGGTMKKRKENIHLKKKGKDSELTITLPRYSGVLLKLTKKE